MKQRDFVLTIISLCTGKPGFGRTSLQKVTYLSSLATGQHLDFRPHFYGPFSQTVEQEVEALVLSELVEEKSKVISPLPRRAGAKYEYSLTSLGEDRIQGIQKEFEEEVSQLASFIGTVDDVAGSLEQGILAPASKVIFIEKQEGRKLSEEEIVGIAKNLGWTIESDQLQRVEKVVKTVDAYLES